uniref:NADH-ubiquinone oxidoreductase chain 6 n=1 Tax=Mesophleps albilinella TaxID=1813607 RepID=A0A142CH69_9NEOP|nr:NADH dehydrogenase subunit 6 [Mesophleps albilinella]AMP87976.1 NADH dehydrogenase subunit 6 [Mesophleps albilinella]
MFKILISSFLMFFSLLMFFFNNPLPMGLMILIQTLLICILSGMLIKTYWFSYILFITFLGGLLVLFIYVSSIASNELFFYSFKLKMFSFILLFFSMTFLIFNFNNLFWMNLLNNADMNIFSYSIFNFNNEYKINISKLYNKQTFLLMLMLIIYLFITLIAIVKITNIFFGPLRSSFN